MELLKQTLNQASSNLRLFQGCNKSSAKHYFVFPIYYLNK